MRRRVLITGLLMMASACDPGGRAPEGKTQSMPVYVRDLNTGRCIELPDYGVTRVHLGLQVVPERYCQGENIVGTGKKR